ncbi:hypothetical protein HK100_007336 [Physocladia obscura]|uniref:DUF726-domain-containing protein n=1 Tax=Physocladia obscura TaxID=109957 RepID=A0AAD5T4S4_9FUNG|nr:hypothetical protein HK100_007336 [Physocladia obscura]
MSNHESTFASFDTVNEADWGFAADGRQITTLVTAAVTGVGAGGFDSSRDSWADFSRLSIETVSQPVPAPKTAAITPIVISSPTQTQAPAYDTFDTFDATAIDDDDTIGLSTTNNNNNNNNSTTAAIRPPVITKSHQLSHIQSIFNDSQKIAYVGLCFLEIHAAKERRSLVSAGYMKSKSSTQHQLSQAKVASAAYAEWADRFMRMLYAFLDVSEAEQTMIENLARHGLIPSDLSRSLLEDAQKALERLEKAQQEKEWLEEQEAKWNPGINTPVDTASDSLLQQQVDVSDIRFTILSHLFILCICDGFYDARSRTLLRAVAAHLNIDWWSVAKLENTISDQLRIQDAESNESTEVVLEEKIIEERNKKDSQGRWLYMGLAAVGGAAVIGVTAGFAAPLIASGIASALTTFHIAGGVGAGVTAFMGGTTGIAIIASSGASIGGGLTGYKMAKRTRGIEEFEFIRLEEALISIKANKKKRESVRAKRDAAKLKDEKKKATLKLAATAGSDANGDSSSSPSRQEGEKKLTSADVDSPSPLISLANSSTTSSQDDLPRLSFSSKRDFISGLQVPGSPSHRRGSSASSLASTDRITLARGEITAPPIIFTNKLNKDSAASEGGTEDVLIPTQSPATVANPKPSVLITIAGWVGSLDSRDDFSLPFSTITPGVHGEQYSLVWETQSLIELGHAVKIFVSEVTGFLVQQGIQYFLLPMLMAGLTGPLWMMKLTYMVDNPWGNGLTKARKAGRILADTLLNRVQGNRPVTLVGFSLGARVIYYCLLELSSRGEVAFNIVEEAYMFGTPVMATTKEWRAISSVVSGRLVNGYHNNDWVLSMLYRASSAFLADVAGLNPVGNVPRIENYDLSGVLKSGHLEYRSAMPRILKHVGFSIDDEFFDDGEKEAEQERLDKEAELERLKNEKEQAKEDALRKKQEEYEEKMRKRKEDEEVRKAEIAAKKAAALELEAKKAAAAAATPRKASWFSSLTKGSFSTSAITSSSVSSTAAQVEEEFEFEIKEIKSTLPPLVLSLGNIDVTTTATTGANQFQDVSLI